MDRVPLISVSIKDCTIQAFRSSESGGQHRNKVSTAIRCIHEPSGAVATATDSKSQYTNKREAFLRMIETKAFKNWLRIESAKRLGKKSIEQIVDELMSPSNIKTEICINGRWAIGEPSF